MLLFILQLETNSDENLSITEDSLGTESETNILPSDSKLSIEFADYMEIIWENYQRVLLDFDDSLSPKTSTIDSKKSSALKNSTSVEWLNVAVGRVVYDFITQKKWCDEVMVRIQKKLDKIDVSQSHCFFLIFADVLFIFCFNQLMFYFKN